MKKSSLNSIIDIVSFIGFALLVATGLLLKYRLPPGSGAWRMIWDLDRHGWGDVHFVIALVFLGLLTVHLWLHWKWIVCQFKERGGDFSGKRLAIGVLAFVALVTLILAPLLSPIEKSEMPVRGSRHYQQQNISTE